MQAATTGGTNGVSELTIDTLGNGVVHVPRQSGEKEFVYEYSNNDANTWNNLTSLNLTKLSLANQTPSATIYVRYYGISKTGKSTYSQAKVLLCYSFYTLRQVQLNYQQQANLFA